MAQTSCSLCLTWKSPGLACNIGCVYSCVSRCSCVFLSASSPPLKIRIPSPPPHPPPHMTPHPAPASGHASCKQLWDELAPGRTSPLKSAQCSGLQRTRPTVFQKCVCVCVRFKSVCVCVCARRVSPYLIWSRESPRELQGTMARNPSKLNLTERES